MNAPTVSVIIPTFNTGRFIDCAIESVYQQTYRDYEIIVVDDGSTDDTGVRLERHRDRIQYIRQGNAGVSVARNQGILAARGEYVAFLDADDAWLPTKLEKQISKFLQNPATVLVYTDFNPTADMSANRGSHFASLKHLATGSVFYELVHENFIGTPTTIVKRSALAECGLFDSMLRGAEDYDFWLRLSRVGEFDCIEEILVDRRIHSTNTVQTLRFARELVKAYTLFLTRWGNDARAAAAIRKNLAQAWWDLAYGEWLAGNTREARNAYWNAAAFGKSRMSAMIRAAACCMPGVVVRRLQQRSLSSGVSQLRQVTSIVEGLPNG